MPKVVVVVVTYNRINLLKECLEALENQTYSIDKILVVDNCSTDGTREWLQNNRNEKYQKLLMEENIGGAGGFSRGMKEACNYICDYVLVLDDDCILNINYVEELLKGFKEYKTKKSINTSNKSISALCGTVYEHEKIATNHRGYMVRHRIHSLDYWREYDETSYEKRYLKCDLASFCGLMISRRTIDVIGYPREEYYIKCDDLEYSLRLIKEGLILNINSASLNHKVKSNNSKKEFDWKYYYDVRNSIDMTKSNGMHCCMLKVMVKTLVVALQNIKSQKHTIMLWANSVIDGLKGCLGKNEDRYKAII